MRAAFYVLILISLVMCGLAHIATWITCFIAVGGTFFACLLNLFKARSRHLRRLARILGLLILAGTTTGLVLEEFHVGRGDPDSWLVRFSIDLIFALFVWRACEHETRQTRMQVVMLSILPLAAMAYTLEASIYILCLVAYAVTFFACLSLEAFAPPKAGVIIKQALTEDNKSTVLKRRFNLPGFARQFTLALIVITILSLTTFFFVPRLEQNPAALATASKDQTGAFPDIELNKTGDIKLDQTLMFTADYPDHGDPVYWRIDVQSTFDGSKWQSSQAGDNPKQSNPPDTLEWHTLKFAQNWRDWRLPTPANTASIAHLSPGRDAQVKLYANKNNIWFRWGWKRSSFEGFKFAIDTKAPENSIYYKLSEPTLGRKIWIDFKPFYDFARGIKPTAPREYAAPPSVSERVMSGRIWPNKRDPYYNSIYSFARSLTQEAQDNLEAATIISNYLSENYNYSLSRPERQTPVVYDFLFNQKFGHCEVFSSSMIVLLNILNIPARNVTGFMSNEFHDGENYVRASHAHSWVEVYDENTSSWVRFDPTPPSTDDNQEVSLWVRFNDWFLTYKSQNLYHWIPEHISTLTGLLTALLCGLLTFWALLAWFDLKLKRSAVTSTSAGVFAALSICIAGWIMFAAATTAALLGTLCACLRITRINTNTHWRNAIEHFRTESAQYDRELATASLETFWTRSQNGKKDDIDRFFETAITALYADAGESQTESRIRRLKLALSIRRYLRKALQHMAQ